MTIQQLRYFLAAARQGSFSAAARGLHLSQPALAEQVRLLEREFGVPLFVRLGRGVRLTNAGAALRPHAEQILSAAEEARESVVEGGSVWGGTVSFGVLRAAFPYVLPDLVTTFLTRYPDAQLQLPGLDSGAMARAVREGTLEAAIVVLPVEDHDLDVRPLMRDEVLYVTADADRARTAVTTDQLAAAPLILYGGGNGSDDPTRRQLAERAQQLGLKLVARVEIEDVEEALRMVRLGLGDTIAARTLTLRPGFPAELSTARFAEPLYDTYAFIARRGTRLSPAARELASMCEERMRAYAGSVASSPRLPSSPPIS